MTFAEPCRLWQVDVSTCKMLLDQLVLGASANPTIAISLGDQSQSNLTKSSDA